MRRTLAAAILLASPAALAQQPDALATRPGWEFGAQVAQYKYEEPNFAKLSGVRGGLVGAYTFTWPNQMFFRIDARESYGSLKYEGSGTADAVPDLILEARGVAGMDFRAGSIGLSPYLGLGYRYLYDDLTGYSTTGAAGYRRYSNYLYAPVGLTMRIELGSNWVFAPTAEMDIFIQGKQKSMLSDANPGFPDVTNTQKHGSGYRLYLMFEKDHLTVGPFMHYWHIQDSEMQPAGFEPENFTHEYGLELRYRF